MGAAEVASIFLGEEWAAEQRRNAHLEDELNRRVPLTTHLVHLDVHRWDAQPRMGDLARALGPWGPDRRQWNGTISVRLYNFVPGSNAARNFITPAGWIRTDRASSKAAPVCQWGNINFQGAQGLGDNPLIYPCLRWGWAGHSDPQVYFRDHTPAEWPVWQSVADWNTTVGIDSYYIWETTPCPSTTTGKHCVNVWAGPYGTAKLRAWIDYRYDDRSNRLIDGSVAVYFNTSYNHGDANEHRATVCEELGHALGVGHNTRNVEASCMNISTGVSPLNDRFPGTNDKGLLTYVVYPD